MQTLETLKRRMESTNELHSVVRTMKSLAVVNIRQYEKAAESISDYARTVDLGLYVVLQKSTGIHLRQRKMEGKKTGAIVFGSDQGMCGSFNEDITDHVFEYMEVNHYTKQDMRVISVGERASGILADEGFSPEKTIYLPGSVDGITEAVQDILFQVQSWNDAGKTGSVFLFYNHYPAQARYTPGNLRLLPMDAAWMEERKTLSWDSGSLPFFTMDREELFGELVREYLFIFIFRAFVESLASENAARLSAMQGAEKNIRELSNNLSSQYHRIRQMSITEELLDIVSGFEALSPIE